MELDDQFFRREFGRLVAALTRHFGMRNLALAEDAAQDAFSKAVEVWKYRGVPENPSAWLMTTAKNRALDILRHQRVSRTANVEIGLMQEIESSVEPISEHAYSSKEINDDLLRTMFSCCHAQLPEEAHVSLILNILCGFSVDEVASTLLSSHNAIEKRLTRAKKTLAQSKKLFDLANTAEFYDRLPSVHRALYLLFSEGYHGGSPDNVIRSNLCREAIRLSSILIDNPYGKTTATCALSALMCFNAARLPSRLDSAGHLTSLSAHDRSVWNQELLGEGFRLFQLSSQGAEFSEYHLEAAIAAQHASAKSIGDTNWRAIVGLYDRLLELHRSPVIELNRAIALGQIVGPEQALEAIAAINNVERLSGYPFFYAALGEFELRRGNLDQAKTHFHSAKAVARNPLERDFFERRVESVTIPLNRLPIEDVNSP